MGNFNSEDREKTGTTTISLLINSVYYFIECVFILSLCDGYRLVALHNGRVLTDASYESLKGARIAFTKLYSDKAWRRGTKAQWSHFYDPDLRWLEEKIGNVRE